MIFFRCATLVATQAKSSTRCALAFMSDARPAPGHSVPDELAVPRVEPFSDAVR